MKVDVPDEWVEAALNAGGVEHPTEYQRYAQRKALQVILPKVRKRLDAQTKTMAASGYLPSIGEVWDTAFPPERTLPDEEQVQELKDALPKPNVDLRD